jgi:hypothetical protein
VSKIREIAITDSYNKAPYDSMDQKEPQLFLIYSLDIPGFGLYSPEDPHNCDKSIEEEKGELKNTTYLYCRFYRESHV